MKSHATFSESNDDEKIDNVQYSHVSIEVGHLYFEDYEAGQSKIIEHFEVVKPWLDATILNAKTRLASPRLSTCFLIDDYFNKFTDHPNDVIETVLSAAEQAGVEIDYISREAACARFRNSEPARILESKIVQDPPEGTNGSRPLFSQTGWLSNGVRSTDDKTLPAMEVSSPWVPAIQNGARNHSIFLDVEMWDEYQDSRRWSCPFLASVWQLMRLGLLRDYGKFPWGDIGTWDRAQLSHSWDEVPAVMKMNSRAKPFCAYRTVSIIESRFIPIEHAVRHILGQVALDAEPLKQANVRAAEENLIIPDEMVDRIGYVFVAEG